MPEYDASQHFAQTYDLIFYNQKAFGRLRSVKPIFQWNIVNENPFCLNVFH